MMVKQDDLTLRTYHQFTVNREGQPRIAATFSVETLRNAEISEDGSLVVGVTDASLYLFRNGEKLRFTPHTRVVYTNMAISPDGRRMVLATSDMMFSRYILSHCETGGRVLWEQDFEHPITVVGTDPDCAMVAAGTDDGSVFLYDSQRNLRWRFEHSGAVTSLMVVSRGACLAGISSGVLSAIDCDGNQQWTYHAGGEILSLDASMDGSVVVLAARAPNGNTALSCLDGEGAIVWEHTIPGQNCSLSISTDGAYFAVMESGGRISLFELRFGEESGASSQSANRHYRAALEAREAGDVVSEMKELERALRLDPAHLEACDRLTELRSRQFEAKLTASRELESQDLALALGSAKEALALEPLSGEAAGRVRELRDSLVSRLLAEASVALDAGQYQAAVPPLQKAIELDFLNREVREKVAEGNRKLAVELAARAESLASDGKESEALKLMEHAHEFHSDENSARKLRELQAQVAFTTGMAHYKAQRYPEAIYQFKKALNLRPDFADAERYLRYSEKFVMDNQISERFTKLE